MKLILCFVVVVVVHSLSPVKKEINQDKQHEELENEVDLNWSYDPTPDMNLVKLYPSETDPSLLIQPTPPLLHVLRTPTPSGVPPAGSMPPSGSGGVANPTVCTLPSSLCPSPTSSGTILPGTGLPGKESKPTQQPKPSKGKPGHESDINNKIRKEIKNIIDSLTEISKTLSG